jgi:hypothetical protein
MTHFRKKNTLFPAVTIVTFRLTITGVYGIVLSIDSNFTTKSITRESITGAIDIMGRM